MMKITIVLLMATVCCINGKANPDNGMPNMPPMPDMPEMPKPDFSEVPTADDITTQITSGDPNSYGNSVSTHFSSSTVNGKTVSEKGGEMVTKDGDNVTTRKW